MHWLFEMDLRVPKGLPLLLKNMGRNLRKLFIFNGPCKNFSIYFRFNCANI